MRDFLTNSTILKMPWTVLKRLTSSVIFILLSIKFDFCTLCLRKVGFKKGTFVEYFDSLLALSIIWIFNATKNIDTCATAFLLITHYQELEPIEDRSIITLTNFGSPQAERHNNRKFQDNQERLSLTIFLLTRSKTFHEATPRRYNGFCASSLRIDNFKPIQKGHKSDEGKRQYLHMCDVTGAR